MRFIPVSDLLSSGFKKILRQVEDVEYRSVASAVPCLLAHVCLIVRGRIKKHALTGRPDCQQLMDKYVWPRRYNGFSVLIHLSFVQVPPAHRP